MTGDLPCWATDQAKEVIVLTSYSGSVAGRGRQSGKLQLLKDLTPVSGESLVLQLNTVALLASLFSLQVGAQRQAVLDSNRQSQISTLARPCPFALHQHQ